MSFWAQAWEIARVDLLVERRVGESAKVILPFAVAALIVFPLALDARLSLLGEIGTGIFWALSVLFGLLVALRHSADDSPERRDMQALLGVDPAARFAGRTISGFVVVASMLLLLLVAMVGLFAPELPGGAWPVLVASTLLLALGITQLGTLAGEVAAGLANRSTLAGLIVAPLSIPLVIGASQSVQAVARDTGILPWILLLIAGDLALAVAGVALARPLEEATR